MPRQHTKHADNQIAYTNHVSCSDDKYQYNNQQYIVVVWDSCIDLEKNGQIDDCFYEKGGTNDNNELS